MKSRGSIMAADLLGLFSPFLLPLGIALALGVVVWWDAKRLGSNDARSWALGVIVLAIVFLPIYLVFRFTGRIGKGKALR
jgi:predicted PurR-regulated permease PerM